MNYIKSLEEQVLSVAISKSKSLLIQDLFYPWIFYKSFYSMYLL